MLDTNGREARPGDLIRIYHYRDRSTGRKCYMYSLVVLVTDEFEVSNRGKHLYCVTVSDIWKKESLADAHKCRLDVVGPFEIIDGLSRMTDGNLETWYERKRQCLL